ncbi:MAG: glycosyltransferase [Cryobacterium sp.]|nr:glycosyltransferase [Cryobacterium sp.]
MRILVHPHTLEIGGSQINAIELAESVAKIPGYDTIVVAEDGVLADDIRGRGLELILAPPRRTTPSPARIGLLNRIVDAREIDLVHPYEWDTTLDVMFGPGLVRGVPVVSTVLSMDVPYFIPRSVPMIVGTRELQTEQSRWRPDVHLMEPPVDTHRNAPGVTGRATETRRRWNIAPDELLVVVVGRLAARLKLEGVLAAIEAVGRIAVDCRIHLLVVGDGSSRSAIEHAAAFVNATAEREVVTLAGEQLDPRDFYDAADIAIGMGGSALRSLSFAKPLLVQGEAGFWRTLTPQTLPTFLEQGWYGIGDGTRGVDRCETELRSLAGMSVERRAELGRLGRQLVETSFSLDAAGRSLASIYDLVAARRVAPWNRLAGGVSGGAVLAKHHLAMTGHRVRAIRKVRS